MAAIIEAGDELKVKVPIKNIGVGTGIFRLSGQIYYPNGTPTGTLKEISTGNPMAVHEILPGAMWDFMMHFPVWASGNPNAFDHGQLFDVKFTCQIEGVEGEVVAWDRGMIQHDRGYGTPPKPLAPELVSTTAQSSTSATITISWQGVTAEPPVTSWQVWVDGVRKATLSASARQHTITGLVPGSTYGFQVRACNEIDCTASDVETIQAAHWVPPIGDAVPKLNMVIFTNDTTNEQKTVYPGTSYITIKPVNDFYPEIRVQNIGEGDGEFVITTLMVYAGTNTPAATFTDSSKPNKTYFVQQGLELPILYDPKTTTDDPLGFAEGQMFDLLVTMQAKVGTGYSQVRVNNCVRWSRGLSAPPKPAPPFRISTVAQSSTSATMTIGWEGVSANPAVIGYEIYRGGSKIATVGPSVRQYAMSGLVPDMYYNFYIKAGNEIGWTASNSINLKTAAWVPSVGFAVPKLNMAILTDNDEQKIVYPPGPYLTIRPSGYLMAEVRVQNIGEYDGDITIETKMVYAGTNTTAATFVDSSEPDKTYFIQQGLELPILYDTKYLTSDPLGFLDGQMFDLLITMQAVEGSGYQAIRVQNCVKWSRQ